MRFFLNPPTKRFRASSMLNQFMNSSELLQTVDDWLLDQVAPRAEQLNTEPKILLNAFKGLGDQGWLTLRVPVHKGGQGVSPNIYFGFQFLVARYSGALAFLQTQHQSAANFITNGNNDALHTTYLYDMSSGLRRLGIGFSHLRRPVSPLHAVSVTGGYRLRGNVPWVTGHGIFEECIIAATLPDGKAIFGIIPLTDQPHNSSISNSSINISAPLPLLSMAVTNTVSVELDNWFLPTHQVVDIKPANWLETSDRRGVLKAASLALGCAQAGLDCMTQAIEQKGWRSLTNDRNRLQQAVNDCLATCLEQIECSSLSESDVAYRRSLRAQAIDLAGRCAHGAIAIVGGAANMLTHPAQRIYREALVFTVSGQTPELAQSILTHLASDLYQICE